MKILIKSLEQMAAYRPEDYLIDVLSSGEVQGQFLEITREKYGELLGKYRPSGATTPSQCCNKTPTSFPPITTQAKNALGAVGRIANAAIRGKRIKASDEVIEKRRSICSGCEFWTNGRCKICGCYTKIKITLDTEHCPLPEPKW